MNFASLRITATSRAFAALRDDGVVVQLANSRASGFGVKCSISKLPMGPSLGEGGTRQRKLDPGFPVN